MEIQSAWTAKLALACYFALVGGTFIGATLVALILFIMGIDILDPPFPIALVSLPVNEVIILGVALLFARYKGAGVKGLGLKKASLKILTIVSIVAVPLFLLATGISVGEEMVFGPDPMAELLAKSVTPRNSLQLVAMIAISLALVGPCEELATRGFVQKGFENSFGKTGGSVDRFCAVWTLAWSEYSQCGYSTVFCRLGAGLCMAANGWKHHRFGFDARSIRLNSHCSNVFSQCLKTLYTPRS